MAKLKATSVAGDLTVTGKVTSTVAGATTSTIGTVKLNNATNSTSTTEAATAAAVKAAYDKGNHSHPYAPTSHGNHVPTTQAADARKFLRNDNTWQGLPGASTSATGIVQLNDATNSTSTTTAATANAVKKAYDLANGKANSSHGNHVPTTQTANSGVFLRNDNTWATPSPDSIGSARGSRTTGSTGATAGWYRIAQTGTDVGNNTGTFMIRASASGKHSSTILTVGITYGQNPVIQQLSHTTYSTTGISKARIVYHTTYSGNKAYLEVYVPDATARSMDIQQCGTLGWSLLSPSTAGSVPSGYSNKEITLATNKIVSDINGTINGFSIEKSVPSNAVFTDTKYSNATTSASGLMSNTDKSKLDGIATGANKYTHPNDANTRHVTDTEKGNWNGAVTKANDWNSFKTNGGTIGGDILSKTGKFATESERIVLDIPNYNGIELTKSSAYSLDLSSVWGGSIGEKQPFYDIYLSGMNKNSHGYTKLPNGMTMQWTIMEVTSNGTYAIKMPISFGTDYLRYMISSGAYSQALEPKPIYQVVKHDGGASTNKNQVSVVIGGLTSGIRGQIFVWAIGY